MYAGRVADPSVKICPVCNRPTFLEGERQYPGVTAGQPVDHLPPEIAAIYAEARNSLAASAPTAAVLTLRKLLMNVAVQEGAPGNQPFLAYVDYLAEAGYIPPNGRGWVDHIRKKGNEATHEIALMNPTEAMELLSFAEMLLKFVYEFPRRIPTLP